MLKNLYVFKEERKIIESDRNPESVLKRRFSEALDTCVGQKIGALCQQGRLFSGKFDTARTSELIREYLFEEGAGELIIVDMFANKVEQENIVVHEIYPEKKNVFATLIHREFIKNRRLLSQLKITFKNFNNKSSAKIFDSCPANSIKSFSYFDVNNRVSGSLFFDEKQLNQSKNLICHSTTKIISKKKKEVASDQSTEEVMQLRQQLREKEESLREKEEILKQLALQQSLRQNVKNEEKKLKKQLKKLKKQLKKTKKEKRKIEATQQKIFTIINSTLLSISSDNFLNETNDGIIKSFGNK